MNTQNIILEWYKKEGRHTLPWRHTTDLYKITVAEIMLQQTNVPKVIERYTAFLKKFPAWHDLAHATPAVVLTAWQGLGYNRRALYLHRMAQEIVQKYNGKLPENPETLSTLPGMGPYTRHAVLIFGRNADFSAADVNIHRILRRLHGNPEWSREKEKIVAQEFVPKGKSREWHNAMMDFASMVCTKKKPQCMTCPLAQICKSYPEPQDQKSIRKKEPGRTENGKYIPRRIFRGRVIEILRRGPANLSRIGKSTKKDWQEKGDQKWLSKILTQLEKEGMIEIIQNHWQLKS